MLPIQCSISYASLRVLYSSLIRFTIVVNSLTSVYHVDKSLSVYLPPASNVIVFYALWSLMVSRGYKVYTGLDRKSLCPLRVARVTCVGLEGGYRAYEKNLSLWWVEWEKGKRKHRVMVDDAGRHDGGSCVLLLMMSVVWNDVVRRHTRAVTPPHLEMSLRWTWTGLGNMARCTLACDRGRHIYDLYHASLRSTHWRARSGGVAIILLRPTSVGEVGWARPLTSNLGWPRSPHVPPFTKKGFTCTCHQIMREGWTHTTTLVKFKKLFRVIPTVPMKVRMMGVDKLIYWTIPQGTLDLILPGEAESCSDSRLSIIGSGNSWPRRAL